IVAIDRRMQREMLCRVLHDQERIVRISNVIVPAFSDRNTLKQVIAAVERLPQLQQVGVTAELDAELAPHSAAAAIATDEIMPGELRYRTAGLHFRTHTGGILRKGDKLAAILHVDRRQSFRNGFEQWLQRVLRDQLIRLK